MTLPQLDTWLRTAAPVGSLSMLEGYLTAIVVGPCSIAPDMWFVDLLGARGRIATAQDTALAALTAVVARFNAISEGLFVANTSTRRCSRRRTMVLCCHIRGAWAF